MHKVDLDALEEHYENAPLWDSSMDPVYRALPALIAEVRQLRQEAERARWCEENKALVAWSDLSHWKVSWVVGGEYHAVNCPDRNAAIDAARGVK